MIARITRLEHNTSHLVQVVIQEVIKLSLVKRSSTWGQEALDTLGLIKLTILCRELKRITKECLVILNVINSVVGCSEHQHLLQNIFHHGLVLIDSKLTSKRVIQTLPHPATFNRSDLTVSLQDVHGLCRDAIQESSHILVYRTLVLVYILCNLIHRN